MDFHLFDLPWLCPRWFALRLFDQTWTLPVLLRFFDPDFAGFAAADPEDFAVVLTLVLFPAFP